MDYIYEIFAIGKYIVLLLAIVGLAIIIIGAYKGNREQIIGGLLTIAAAIVIGLCGYIMYSQTDEKIYDYMERKEKKNQYYY